MCMSFSAAACSLSLIWTCVPANVTLATPKARKIAIAISFFMSPTPTADLGARLRQCQSAIWTTWMATAEHLQFMAEAIAEARRAEAEGEVPIGAVAVAEGQIVGAGHNRPIGLSDPTAHAE